MKTAIFASIIASAAAFAPAQQGARSSALAANFDGEIGVTAPLGLYDPLNVLDTADQERFDHLRAVELKHGRIAMLAVVGYLTAEGM